MKKRFFKKNQIIITALAVLIAIAGYINYADSTMNRETESTGAAAEAGDESTAVLDENTILQDIESLDQDLTDETADAGETASAEETAQAAGEDAGEVQTESQTSSGDGTEGENAGGGRLIQVDIDREMRKSFLDYSMVICLYYKTIYLLFHIALLPARIADSPAPSNYLILNTL